MATVFSLRGSMPKTSVKKAVMHSVLSRCVCTHTGSGTLSVQASQSGNCKCFGSGSLEQDRPGCKTLAFLGRACTKQCGAASASLLGPLPLVFFEATQMLQTIVVTDSQHTVNTQSTRSQHTVNIQSTRRGKFAFHIGKRVERPQRRVATTSFLKNNCISIILKRWSM